MKFSSDPAVFTPALAERVTLAAVAWAPAPLMQPAEAAPLAPVDTAELTARQHAAEVEAAFAEGFEAGAAEARAEVAERAQAALAVTAAAAAQLHAAEGERLASLQADVCALAVAIARQIVGREVKDGQVLADLVRRALADFPLQQPLRLRINPHDLSALTALKAPDGSPLSVAAGRELTWVPAPELERGGIIVEGRDRIVDGRVDLALERIYRRLADG